MNLIRKISALYPEESAKTLKTEIGNSGQSYSKIGRIWSFKKGGRKV